MSGGDGTDRMIGWLASAEHMEWLRGQEQALLGFPTRVASDEGDALVPGHDGRPVPGEVAPTFGAARMAHVHALAALRGRPGARPVAATLLAGLATAGSGGWPESRDSDEDEPQALYTLAFVILAAASGVALEGRAHRPLLDAALARL